MKPYFGDVRWWRQYLEVLPDGVRAMPEMPRRELTRCRLTAAGREPLMLSIPIQGGATAVKRQTPDEWLLSDHGRWQSVHTGALEAFYGRTPYYRHLADRLIPLIAEVRTGDCHAEKACMLTEEIHKVIAGMLGIDRLAGEIRHRCAENPDLWRARREMLERRYDDSDCILQPLTDCGPEAIFLLLPAL